MSEGWLTFLEILKFTIPAIVVFVTVFFVLRSFLQNHYKIQLLEYQMSKRSESMPMRFQALERMSLLCERISLQNLLLRINSANMTASDLHASLLIAIQQEFDHNVSQQIYISENLWQIILQTRLHANQVIQGVAASVDGSAPSSELMNKLLEFSAQQKEDPVLTAQSAIKKEATLYL